MVFLQPRFSAASFTPCWRLQFGIGSRGMGALTIAVSLPPLARDPSCVCDPMWQLRTLPVVFTDFINSVQAISGNISASARLALAQVPIGHHAMAIELAERFLNETLEAAFQAMTPADSNPSTGRAKGINQAKGISSSVMPAGSG